jgi:prepilin-type processing-associated H-X9-DG protein
VFGGAANQHFPVYIDPADESGAQGLRDIPMTLPDASAGYYATGSYAANGLVFGSNDARLPQTFADGCSYTIMISERPQVCRTPAGQSIYNLWGLGFYSPHMPAFATLTPTDPPGLLSTGQVVPVEPLSARDRADELLVRTGRQDAEPRPPDFATPVQVLRGAGPCDPRLPGSPHYHGMQVAMADGSVRVFARSVSPWVFWAICTPDGGEDVRGDW